jgi:hypothetical protein
VAETLNFSTILNHLAWLREQLSIKINQRNAHAGALLAYNAAAMLQWRFVLPLDDKDWIVDAAERKKAAVIIDDFVWKVRGLHQEAKALVSLRSPTSIATKSVLDRLTDQLTKVLRQLPKITGLPEPKPVRNVGLEQQLQTEDLVGDWVRSRRESKASAYKGGSDPAWRSGLLSAMAGVAFAQQPHQGATAARSASDCAEVVAALLGLAVEDHVRGLPARSAERTTALGQDLKAQLTARSS